ncbi:MAG: hypothetical protein RL368_93 [Pseudomonadota bacterium]|jgi:hypothetical protein
MEYGKCATETTNKIIPAEENKRKLILNNPSQRVVRKIQIDGCLPVEGKRCDYMFEIDEPTTEVIYLELKGCDIEKACLQLAETIDLFLNKHRHVKKSCHIVASRVPKAGTKVQQLKVQMLKNKKVELIVSTDQATVQI